MRAKLHQRMKKQMKKNKHAINKIRKQSKHNIEMNSKAGDFGDLLRSSPNSDHDDGHYLRECRAIQQGFHHGRGCDVRSTFAVAALPLYVNLSKDEAVFSGAGGNYPTRVARWPGWSAKGSLDDGPWTISAVAVETESSSRSGRRQKSSESLAAQKKNSKQEEIKNEANMHKQIHKRGDQKL